MALVAAGVKVSEPPPMHREDMPVIVVGPTSGVTVTVLLDELVEPLHPVAVTLMVAVPEKEELHVT